MRNIFLMILWIKKESNINTDIGKKVLNQYVIMFSKIIITEFIGGAK